MALMSTADALGRVLDPAPASTWSFIEHETLKVSRNCIGKKLGGGFVFIAGMAESLSFILSVDLNFPWRG